MLEFAWAYLDVEEVGRERLGMMGTSFILGQVIARRVVTVWNV